MYVLPQKPTQGQAHAGPWGPEVGQTRPLSSRSSSSEGETQIDVNDTAWPVLGGTEGCGKTRTPRLSLARGGIPRGEPEQQGEEEERGRPETGRLGQQGSGLGGMAGRRGPERGRNLTVKPQAPPVISLNAHDTSEVGAVIFLPVKKPRRGSDRGKNLPR